MTRRRDPLADFVERFGGALADAGFPRLPARVFAALMSDDDGAMTSADLTEALAISPAAVSGAIGYLSRLGIVRRERERGSRRDVYVVDDDAWHGVLLQADQVYAPIIDALSRGREATSGTPAAARVALSLEFLRWINREMNELHARWEEHKATLR